MMRRMAETGRRKVWRLKSQLQTGKNGRAALQHQSCAALLLLTALSALHVRMLEGQFGAETQIAGG